MGPIHAARIAGAAASAGDRSACGVARRLRRAGRRARAAASTGRPSSAAVKSDCTLPRAASPG